MFENIKDGDLVTLKLASGEEVIAQYKSGADSYISIEKALVSSVYHAGTLLG